MNTIREPSLGQIYKNTIKKRRVAYKSMEFSSEISAILVIPNGNSGSWSRDTDICLSCKRVKGTPLRKLILRSDSPACVRRSNSWWQARRYSLTRRVLFRTWLTEILLSGELCLAIPISEIILAATFRHFRQSLRGHKLEEPTLPNRTHLKLSGTKIESFLNRETRF